MTIFNGKAVACFLGIVLTAALLTGCQETGKNTPTASPAPSTSASAEPPELTEFPEIAELDYEPASLPADSPLELPFAPETYSSNGEELLAHAPRVNMPELKEWVEAKLDGGWAKISESEGSGFYSATLTLGKEFIFIDAVLSKEQPFTSILAQGIIALQGGEDVIID